MKDNRHSNISTIVQAPFDGSLSPRGRLESCLKLSELVTNMATHAICHTIVDYEYLAGDERMSVARAFLERVTSTHLCNHKLTKEGIALKFRGETFQLHEEYKTMLLTRSVYEHLVMFFFVYNFPKTDEERRVVWDYWKINSIKNLSDLTDDASHEEVEQLRKDIFTTRLGMECYNNLDEWTSMSKPTQNGCIAFSHRPGQSEVRRVSYNQAWRFLFSKEQEDISHLYRHLSIHSHPIYNGLLQYQDQAASDEGYDGIPLYLSCCFLAYLCRLFLRLIPDGDKMFDNDFSLEDRLVFKALSRIGS